MARYRIGGVDYSVRATEEEGGVVGMLVVLGPKSVVLRRWKEGERVRYSATRTGVRSGRVRSFLLKWCQGVRTKLWDWHLQLFQLSRSSSDAEVAGRLAERLLGAEYGLLVTHFLTGEEEGGKGEEGEEGDV